MKTRPAALRAGLMVILISATGGVRGAQSDNHLLEAVTAPGPVAIDGRLDDWDRSGRIEVFANSRTRSRYSATVSAMHDQDFFYLAVEWRDTTPLFNAVDSRFDAGNGWRGDCLQLRIKTDVAMHVDCWYSDPAEAPVVAITYGSLARKAETPAALLRPLPDALAAGAREAFTKREDGTGYVQEIALPWKLLSGSAAVLKATGQPLTEGRKFVAGDSFSMAMEFLWAGADGKTWPVHRYADLLKVGTSQREFLWTAEDAWGTVRLLDRGNLARAATPAAADTDAAAQPTTGPVAIAYDLPADGFATIVIEDEQGNRVRNLIGMAPRNAGPNLDHWDGLDEQGRLAAPGRYRWRGLFHRGVVPVYEATYGTPGDPPWDSADGRGAWLSDHNAPCAVAASGGRMLLAAPGSEAGWSLIGTDDAGRKLWGERKFQDIRAIAADGEHVYCGMSRLAPNGAASSPPQVSRCLAATGAYAPFAPGSAGAAGPLVVDVAAAGESARLVGIAVSADQLAVALAGPDVIRFLDKRTGQRLRDVPLAAPAGIDFAPAGPLFAISGESVVRLDGDTWRPVVSQGLRHPVDLAVNGAGEVYVSDPGTQQVHVFAADGRLLRSIGTPGGRRQPGLWNDQALKNPAGIDLDDEGRLWVAEADMMPKRISVWTATGKLAFDLLGPTTYGGMGGCIDPLDPERLFGSGCEWRLRGGGRAARPVAVRFRPEDERAAITGGGILRAEGREYFLSRRDRLFVRQGEGFVPCASFGKLKPEQLQPLMADGQPPKPGNHLWSDANGDGLMQRSEVVFDEVIPADSGYWGGFWLDDDFNAVIVPGGYGRVRAVRLPRSGWTASGAPTWDVSQAQVVCDLEVPGGPSKLIATDSARGLVLACHTPITAVRFDGSVAWTYANPWNDVHGSHTAPVPDRDDVLVGAIACIGVADTGGPLGKLFAMNSNMGRAYLFTTDGLFVAAVFQDFRSGAEPMPATATPGTVLADVSMGCEWFGGSFFGSPQRGYGLVAGFTAFNLIRLEGLETLTPLAGGDVAVTAADLAAAEQGLARAAAARAQPAGISIGRPAKPVVVDGSLEEYPESQFVEWSAGGLRAQGVVAVDGERLCVGWRVRGDRNPMVNAGTDPLELFLTGDSVDVQLGTDPDADPGRTGPVAGDLRLLVSVFEGRPTAVLYRWRTGDRRQSREFRCPWRSETVDEARVLDTAELSIVKNGGDGYTVEAAVPLAELGFAPRPGGTHRLDLGVIGSDAAGMRRAIRSYWANKATGLVSDVPGEIMAHPDRWGTATVE